MGVQGVTPPGAERAFVADPDVILVSSWPGMLEAVKAHPLLSKLRAVREGRLVVLPNERLIALSQYTAEACWDLASRLHPDRVPARRP
jgi:ABC-type Fe3+-hydroxamate transport system substrate-binding protein